jgi:hypothetical protein
MDEDQALNVYPQSDLSHVGYRYAFEDGRYPIARLSIYDQTNAGRNADLYAALRARETDITRRFGDLLVWERDSARNRGATVGYHIDMAPADEEVWPELQANMLRQDAGTAPRLQSVPRCHRSRKRSSISPSEGHTASEHHRTLRAVCSRNRASGHRRPDVDRLAAGGRLGVQSRF